MASAASVQISELAAWIRGAEASLRDHISSLSHADAEMESPREIRYGRDAAGVQIQFWWRPLRSAAGDEFLWDYVDLNGIDLQDVESSIIQILGDVGFRFNPQFVRGCTPKRGRDVSNVPMFDIHPQRFRSFYPAAKTIANAGIRSKAGAFTQDVMNACSNGYIESSRVLSPSTRLRLKLVNRGRIHLDMIQLSMFYADFCHAGKQIFSFPAEMTEMFGRTDVDGIPLDAIKLPYSSMYLHFGRQEELALENGWAPDGAYVSHIGKPGNQVIQFCLTFAPKDRVQYERMMEHPEPSFVQAMTDEQMKVGVGEAVDMVLSERIDMLKKQIANGSDNLRRQSQEAFGDPDALRDATGKYAAEELEMQSSRYAAWSGMLRLVVNGLAYLSAYPEDWEEQIAGGHALPWSITSELESGNHKRARKAQATLAELGYTAVHFCGVRLRDIGYGSTRPKDASEEGEGTTAWTWVRGHWRRQAHGPQWSQHRLRWLMPFKRSIKVSDDEMQEGADAGEDAARGHIYLVS